MSTPQFPHDCIDCVFQGRGWYRKKPVDWYLCKDSLGRTLLARHGDAGPQYSSTTIGMGGVLNHLVLAAIAQGFELTPEEKEQLVNETIQKQFQSSPQHYADCLPPADATPMQPIGTNTVLAKYL